MSKKLKIYTPIGALEFHRDTDPVVDKWRLATDIGTVLGREMVTLALNDYAQAAELHPVYSAKIVFTDE